MNWLTNGSSVMGKFGGHQFAYEKLKGKIEADYNFFYTSNISLKKTLLEKFPFDPEFSKYGWEDIELGYRLHKRVGLKLYYNAQAIGYHDHAMTEDSLAGRMRAIGASAHVFHKKYPELQKVPALKKQFAFWLLSNRFSIFILKFLRNLSQGKWTALYYYALSKKYFLEGLYSRDKS
jgi:GT2 family glycosyltransferase